ncbi:hypothetical protein ACEYW6_08255 [Nostoc sp. UIC 10607]
MAVYQDLGNAFYTQLGRFQDIVDLNFITCTFTGFDCSDIFVALV